MIDKSINFYILTDIHYYSKKIGDSGKAYQQMAERNQKLHAHTKELIEEVWDNICTDKQTGIVLIHGDLTNNGEVVSHQEFRQMLYELEKCGKKVYLTYSTHDYKKDINVTKGYVGDDIIEIPSFTLDDIKGFYDDFGKNQALSIHEPTGSYAVQLKDGIRLLALNDDFGYKYSGYTDKTMKWIKEQVQKAKNDKNYIFVMAHHPIMAASPLYDIFGKKDLIESKEKRIQEFADMGVDLYFSGHSHMQKIDYTLTTQGSLLYNISTSALTGYPPVYRKVTVDLKSQKAHVKSVIVKKVKGINTDGLELDEYLKQKFLGMIGDFVYAGKDKNMRRVKEVAKGISLKPEQIDNKKWIIIPFAKWLYKLSFGKVMRYTKKETRLRPKDHKDIKDKKALPVIVNLIANIYDGKASYSPDSVEYKLIMGLIAIADSVLKYIPFNISKKLGYKNISQIVEPMVYNTGLDNYDISLDLNPQTAKLPSKTDYKPPYKSRKGFFIVMTMCLIAIIFSPVILPVLFFGHLKKKKVKVKKTKKKSGK